MGFNSEFKGLRKYHNQPALTNMRPDNRGIDAECLEYGTTVSCLNLCANKRVTELKLLGSELLIVLKNLLKLSNK
jgi:hypothetical protein